MATATGLFDSHSVELFTVLFKHFDDEKKAVHSKRIQHVLENLLLVNQRHARVLEGKRVCRVRCCQNLSPVDARGPKYASIASDSDFARFSASEASDPSSVRKLPYISETLFLQASLASTVCVVDRVLHRMQECVQDIGLLCEELRGVAFHLKRGNNFDMNVHHAHRLADTRTVQYGLAFCSSTRSPAFLLRQTIFEKQELGCKVSNKKVR